MTTKTLLLYDNNNITKENSLWLQVFNTNVAPDLGMTST